MLQFDETNTNPLYGPDESVDLQTFHSASKETFVIASPIQRCEGPWGKSLETRLRSWANLIIPLVPHSGYR